MESRFELKPCFNFTNKMYKNNMFPPPKKNKTNVYAGVGVVEAIIKIKIVNTLSVYKHTVDDFVHIMFR